MEKKIIFTPVEPNKNLLWLHYKNGLLVLQRFGSKGWEDITNSDQITEAEVMELIKDKANLVGGKVPAEELPSYVDDVIEFNDIQVADAEISSIIGNNLYKNQIRFVDNSTTLPDRIGSEDKYPNMFVNFGENTSEDDWTTFEPEEGKIYVNTTNNHSYRWSGSYLIDLDSNWSQGIKDLQENTIRTDTSQSFSASRLVQAFANLGMKVYVTDSSFLGSTLSAEEIEEVFVSKAILFTDTGDLFSFGAASSSQIYFYKFIDRSSIGYITLNKPDGLVSNGSFEYQDVTAVHFTAQNPALTASQQDAALSNIGLNFVHVDYSLLGTTLTDEMLAVINNAEGIILVDTPSNYSNPTVFIKGNNTSESCIFVSFVTGNTYSIFTFNKSTKLLSNISSGLTYGGSVRYVEEQSLTTAQQERVLYNIGFPLVHLDFALIGTTLDDDIYNAVASAKGIILENVPDDSNAPPLYLVGSSDTSTTIFVSEFNARVWFVLTLSHTSKKFSLLSTGYATDVVRYTEVQDLTDVQKQQARTNIGVQSADELLEDADFIAQLKTKLETA